jgi:hypothetical protein
VSRYDIRPEQVDQARRALQEYDRNPVAQRRYSETDLLVWIFCVDRETAHLLLLAARKTMVQVA